MLGNKFYSSLQLQHIVDPQMFVVELISHAFESKSAGRSIFGLSSYLAAFTKLKR